jgi:hypothetical protein
MGRSKRGMWIFKAARWEPPPVSIEDRIIVEPLSRQLNSTNHMLALRDPINQCSSMIVVVGWYPTIPLEMYIGIVYGSPTDSLVWGITCKTCTRERWDPDQPYGVVVKGCGARMSCWSDFPPAWCVYWFGYPWHYQIWVMTCSLPPLVVMQVT